MRTNLYMVTVSLSQKVIPILNHLEAILEWEMWKIYWIETPSHFIISLFSLRLGTLRVSLI
jgi:hypothetical protein